MQFHNGMIEAIGNTPLIKLKKASAETGCDILGKAEFMNPASRSKTAPRCISFVMPKHAETCVPAVRLSKARRATPALASPLSPTHSAINRSSLFPKRKAKKKDMLRLAGADLIEVPAVPYKDDNNYIKYSGRLAQD